MKNRTLKVKQILGTETKDQFEKNQMRIFFDVLMNERKPTNKEREYLKGAFLMLMKRNNRIDTKKRN